MIKREKRESENRKQKTGHTFKLLSSIFLFVFKWRLGKYFKRRMKSRVCCCNFFGELNKGISKNNNVNIIKIISSDQTEKK
jgi:hypothetical protein